MDRSVIAPSKLLKYSYDMVLQRFISSLLLVFYLASQLAAVPHAHYGEGGTDHSHPHARPHIHLPTLGHHHHQDDRHGTCEHHHDHEHAHPPCPHDSPAPCNDHDCNTVYLSYEIGAFSLGGKRALMLPDWVALGSVDRISFPWRFEHQAGEIDQFAEIHSPDCPRYLMLRALLL